ncbi:MAG: arsenic transporter [Syntrophothermus sp.]
MSQVIAPGIFIFTLYLVIARPRQINLGLAAMIGAGVALLAGIISFRDLVAVLQIIWNATLALIGIIIISRILDEAGFFEWSALHVARLAGGDGTRAFFFIILLGALVSVFFTNDSTVLILTPIVYEMMRALNLGERHTLPFVMACGFIADTMSSPLVVSNLVNIITADYFRIGFTSYALTMVVPALISLATSLLMLYLFYRKDLPAGYDLRRLKRPVEAIRDLFVFRLGIGVLVLVVAAFFGGSFLRLPVSAIIGAGAAVLLAATYKARAVDAGKILRMAPWHIVVFSLGMYLVVYGLRNAGLTAVAGRMLSAAAGAGSLAATVVTGFNSAAMSSVMNNLPSVMFGALTLDGLSVPAATRQAMVFAHVIGCDLGPKMTPLGSLATLLWMHVLDSKGLKISWRYYLRVGLVITPPVLLATLLALWAWMRFGLGVV